MIMVVHVNTIEQVRFQLLVIFAHIKNFKYLQVYDILIKYLIPEYSFDE